MFPFLWRRGFLAALESGSSSLDAAEVGDIKAIAYNTPQAGWLVCNGAAYSRTTYSRLFARIGTTWGAGDGSTTFNVPNATDRAFWQSGALAIGAYGNGIIPNITGVVTEGGNQWRTASGVFALNGAASVSTHAAGIVSGAFGFNFDASRISSIYGAADRVIPAYVCAKFCIKY